MVCRTQILVGSNELVAEAGQVLVRCNDEVVVPLVVFLLRRA